MISVVWFTITAFCWLLKHPVFVGLIPHVSWYKTFFSSIPFNSCQIHLLPMKLNIGVHMHCISKLNSTHIGSVKHALKSCPSAARSIRHLRTMLAWERSRARRSMASVGKSWTGSGGLKGLVNWWETGNYEFHHKSIFTLYICIYIYIYLDNIHLHEIWLANL